MIPPHVQKLFPSRGFAPTLTAPVKDAPVVEEKASSLSLLPRGAYGPAYSFFSPDGGRTMIDISEGGHVALAFVAYWYIATRWRAQKIAEAPLMVVEEDQDNGNEEWLADHELVGILDEPSPDYDMGELLETTSHYLDNTGAALWVLDKDRIGRTARITPFSRNEFEPKSDGNRLYATFDVQTKTGTRPFSADEVCFFRDSQGSTAWGRGRSRLDIAVSWLSLGEKAMRTIKDLLSNSVWPSAVMVPDKDWNPDEKVFLQYKQDLEQYARGGNKGKPFVALGGGQFTPLSAAIKDLVPTEILNRVESVVSAISGVPAIVLQLQVGMENSPWSQMAQARRMAYDDCIAPAWRRMERVMTKQMLRPVDEDTTHFIRFDKSQIDSLQRDQMEATQVASMMGDQATLNERRALMGLEPASKEQDPEGKADEIPELTKPSFAEVMAGMQGAKDPNADPAADPAKDPAADPPVEDPPKDPPKKYYNGMTREEKFRVPALMEGFRKSAEVVWRSHCNTLLSKDAQQCAELVQALLPDVTEGKSIESKARSKKRAMDAVDRYLESDSKKAWTRTITPLAKQAAERAGAVVAADMDITFQLLHPNLIKFAQKNTARMVKDVSKTTKSLISDIVQGGLDEGATNNQIAVLIKDATGFSIKRAQLIARTETTKAFNGAPEESLADYGKSAGIVFTKEWSTAGDDKVRDEHADMEGETVLVGESFSNGLDYPSEPNCRCTILFDQQED
jgi:SPP1 gp7 family putative phage head morphogenesis protein